MKGAVVFATNNGLGLQAKHAFEGGLFDVVFVQPHPQFENHPEWYPNQASSFEELLALVDTVYFFETPFNWDYIPLASSHGVKTVLFLMYECTTYPLPQIPDILVGGSVCEQEIFGPEVKVLTVPVSKEVTWRERTVAKTFVHNAGHSIRSGRNGTEELLAAIPLVKSPAEFIIRSQFPIDITDPRVRVEIGDVPYDELFNEGDVFIYPDKWGGSCLPLQEAYASGMLVMASHRHPSNLWLPNEPLIPIVGYEKYRMNQVQAEIDSAIVRPEDIATAIDFWFKKDIRKFSLMGKAWKEHNSWAALKQEYLRL